MATRIGVSNFHYAKMTTEDSATSAPVYGTITSAPGLMSINVNPNATVDTLFADDGPFETASTIGKIEVELQKNYLSTAEKAALLGKAIDTNGGLVHSSTDTPPWVAIGFKSLKSNGKYRYCWLYKGKFQDPEDNNETKNDSINWQSDTIKGNFVQLQYPQTVGGKVKYLFKYEVDEDDDATTYPNIPKAIAAWFTEVIMPNKTFPAVTSSSDDEDSE